MRLRLFSRPLLVAFLALLGTFAGLLTPTSGSEYTFAAYNVENYGPLLELGQNKPRKSTKATEALHGVIASLNADILGVCEMGSHAQFEEFKRRLSASGLGYTDFEWLDGGDRDRHLALASRYPIVERHSIAEVVLQSDFAYEKVRRGILDVTIAVTPEVHIRCVGVHLKSKLAAREDEGFIRRTEARLLRNHIDAILAADPNVQLLVYGDFNDTKNSASLREVAGKRGAKETMLPLRLCDTEGDYWTHHWAAQDSYSRIDFIFVNRRLAQAVERSKCYIERSPELAVASDHRPLLATFRAIASISHPQLSKPAP